MAPLPPNTTARLFVDYTVAGHQHTLQCRFDAPNTPNDALEVVGSLLTAFGSQLYLSTFVAARYVVAGGSVGVPVTPVGFPTTWGTGSAAGNESAQYYDLIGRSTSGRRVRVTVFGATVVSTNDVFRIPTTLGPPWSDVKDVLDGAEGTFLAIDGSQPLWYPYINTGINAYWRNQIR